MSETIKYDPDLLRSRATELRGYVSSYADAIDRITNLVNGLPDVWSSTAETKLVAAFLQMLAGFSNVDSSLELFAVALEKSADNMESVDSKYAKKIRAIS